MSSIKFDVMHSLYLSLVLIQIFISFFQDEKDAVRSLDLLHRRVGVYTTVHYFIYKFLA